MRRELDNQRNLVNKQKYMYLVHKAGGAAQLLCTLYRCKYDMSHFDTSRFDKNCCRLPFGIANSVEARQLRKLLMTRFRMNLFKIHLIKHSK